MQRDQGAAQRAAYITRITQLSLPPSPYCFEKVLVDYPKNRMVHIGAQIARHHHERWDGTGYPDGLAGDETPLAARIMAVGDVYDALRSRRPYKDPFPHARCVDIVAEGRGSHFDPEAVDAFLSLEQQFQKVSEELS